MSAIIVDGRYLDSNDNDFALKILDELQHFEESLAADPGRVLVLPPLPARHRFLAHQLTQDHHSGLVTLSVGSEPHRRLTVRAAPLQLPATEPRHPAVSSPHKNTGRMTGGAETCTASAQQRQPRRSKVTAEIYKPPAARQQRPQQPEAPVATPGARGGNSNNRKQPNPHHNLGVTHAHHKPQHVKSPRSNRRKHPQNDRLSLSERSSYSPESSLPTKPALRDYPSSCELSSEASTSVGGTTVNPPVSDLVSGAGEGDRLQHETSVSKSVDQPEVGQKDDVPPNNNRHPATNTPVPNGDLRNYLNRKKQAEEIQNLCNAVESVSNKYFNKTASPYRKENGEIYQHSHVHHDQIHRNNNQNYNEHHRNGNSSNSCVENTVGNNGHNDGYCFNSKMINDSRRARPDQILYVPRGRRQYGTGGDSYRYGNNNSPLTDHNYRPPSPTFSITSIVSEFSGRQRYDGESFSRPSSRLSIYDTDDERFDGRPPHVDSWYNSSRESTPGPSRPMGNANRYSHTSLKLIERSLNQNSVRPASRNGEHSVSETHNSQSKQDIDDSHGMKLSPVERGDRVSKSPTPNRDSIHSKENMINPVNSSPKKRRSRKNRKRQSRSRDHSFDSISRDRGSLGNISVQSGYSNQGRSNGRGYHRPQENSYTVYNSHMRMDGPASLATSRVNSRNPSLERNTRDGWRQQKPVTYPNTPVRSQNFPTNSRALNDFNSLDGPSSLPYGTDNMCRRNSADKPPTGKIRPSNDSRRNSFSNRVGSCSTSARGTPTENLSPTDEKSATQAFDCVASPQESLGNVDSAASHEVESDILAESSASHANADVGSPSPDKQKTPEHPLDNCETEKTEDVSVPLSPVIDDDDDEDDEPLDWAAEMDREDQRQEKLREQRRREEALQAELRKHSSESVGDRQRLEKPSKTSPLNVDERTRRDIGAAIGRDADITPPRHDFSAYGTNTSRQLYIPPNERKSPNKNNGNSPPRPRLQRQYSPPCGSDDHSSSDSPSSPTSADENSQSGLAHVLELFDFPSSFRTADLVAVYQGYQAAGPLDIKWVNDTSALAVFSSVAIAERALQLQHAQIKSVRLSEASAAAKSKAVTIDEELLPARPRPQTSMMLARRLLSGALGVRVNLSREEREREAKAIRDAKDHKRQVAKQKADVWEGNV